MVDSLSVEIKINHRISANLTPVQKEYLMTMIKQYIDAKQKNIEEGIMVALTLDENSAANQVIKDLKLRDIVWIKQECD